MIEKITGLMMRHLSLMDQVIVSSIRLYKSALIRDTDTVFFESENRERLISMVDSLQYKIDEYLNLLSSKEELQEMTPILKAWAYDMDAWVEKTNRIDQETLELLNNEKEKTTQEIANIYTSKEQFRGYNLNSVKR